jgi:hypothetical protein
MRAAPTVAVVAAERKPQAVPGAPVAIAGGKPQREIPARLAVVAPAAKSRRRRPAVVVVAAAVATTVEAAAVPVP